MKRPIVHDAECRNNSVYLSRCIIMLHVNSKILIIGVPKCANCDRIKRIYDAEVVTVLELHEFRANNPEYNSACTHGKESLHPILENELLRRMITKTFLSNECLQLKYPIDYDADDKGKGF